MDESSRADTDPERHVLIVPGIGNSGPAHWQSHWEARHANHHRVPQADWDRPVCTEWMPPLERAARERSPNVFIAAHSLGCLLVAHWLMRTSVRIAGALLVAVPNPTGDQFPAEPQGFAPVPHTRLPCPTLVVTSSDDPYGSAEFARQCADAWGSRFINIGRAGHINAASGLGEWHEGHRLLQSLWSPASRVR